MSSAHVYPFDGGYGGFVAADGGGWWPGIFDTEATARHALTLDIVKVQAVSDEVNHCKRGDRPITMNDLEGAR